MTRQINPIKLPVSGETVMIIPVSMSAETMLTRRQFREPAAPVVTVEIEGYRVNERNPSDPNYKIAYERWESLIQIEITERILRQIALVQTLDDAKKTAVSELREALEGVESLPKNDKVLWLMKIGIRGDRDIQAIIKKAAEMADPQEGGINTEAAGF